MAMDQAVIVAGVGCRRGAAAPEIEAAILTALVRAGVARADLTAIATGNTKKSEPGIAAAAAKLGVTLTVVSDDELKAAGERVATRSDRVLALTGAPSLAEAAALAAAGPSARLLSSRLVVGPATCALAATDVPQ
jgi:cobalt-precorrin 5A hydrolase